MTFIWLRTAAIEANVNFIPATQKRSAKKEPRIEAGTRTFH
jgi:hypothetical protein